MAEGSGSPDINPQIPQNQPDNFVQDPSKRNFLKVVGVGTAVVGAIVGGGAATERSLGKPSIEETFRIGKDIVEISGNDFLPKGGKTTDPSEAVLFLVGAPMRAKASVTHEQSRQLAEHFKVRTFTLDARPKGGSDENSVELEVEALRRYIEKNKIKKITIFGHSIGAVKAVNLAASLEQNNPGIKINGVVLANPKGFYEQERGDLISSWGKEAGIERSLANPRSPHENVFKVGLQLAGSSAADVRQTGLGYPKWLGEQFDALTKTNPNLSKVKAPVVLLIGAKDLLSEAEKILPEEEIIKRMPSASPEELLVRKILKDGRKWEDLSQAEQVALGSKDNYIRMQRQQKAERGRANVKYIQYKMPNVENLKVIVAEKYASHIGFTVERVNQTSHVVSKIFDRLRRPNKVS